MIAAVAEFERDLLVERTQAGLARAKGEGKILGRPARLSEKQRKELARRLQAGETVSGLAREFDGKRCETITVLALAGMSQSCD